MCNFPDGFGSLDLNEVPPRTFHKFSTLPLEIRLRIWRLLAPRSEIVDRVWNNDKLAFGMRRRAPLVMQICRESRREHMLLPTEMERQDTSGDWRYGLWRAGKDDQPPSPGAAVFVNWKKDTIRIYRGSLRPEEMLGFMQVQNLAMDWGLRPCWLPTTCDKGVEFIKAFPNLKVLTLIVHFSPRVEEPPKRGVTDAERKAIRELRQLVRDAMDEGCEKDKSWTAPELRVVPRSRYWETCGAERT